MKKAINLNIDFNRPVRIAEDVYWVGFSDEPTGLHCNPYLIVDGDEALLIDGGSRPDFPVVMMKILQTGIRPVDIQALVYQHYDPDLIGSVSNLEDIISKKDLKIIAHAEGYMYIRHYSARSSLLSIQSINYSYKFQSGRELKFYSTPYSHCLTSFITFDTKSRILFTSDIFGNNYKGWKLFYETPEDCKGCVPTEKCSHPDGYCSIRGMIHFHRKLMTSNKALRYALKLIREIPFEIVAPQHGSIITKKEDVYLMCDLLESIDDIGIDSFIKDKECLKTV